MDVGSSNDGTLAITTDTFAGFQHYDLAYERTQLREANVASKKALERAQREYDEARHKEAEHIGAI